MKFTKVLLSLLLVVVMTVPVFAVDAHPGETVSATITFTSTEAYSFGIAFELPSALELDHSYTDTGAVGPSKWGAFGNSVITSATCTFVFKVPSDIQPGNYEIKATLEEATDRVGNPVNATVTGSTITVFSSNKPCEHVWDEGKVTKEPTCAEPGVRTYTCTICGETKTETIPATGNHTWDKGKVTKEPTCAEPGVRTYTCTICGETKTETIPATGIHTWDEGKVTTEPTCGRTGVKTYTCKICGETKTETIPAAGEHTWDEGKVTTEPTCGAAGVKTYTCTICGATETVTVPATGDHTWDEGKVTTQPTEKEPGIKTYTCTVCGATKTETIPAIGNHVWDEGKITTAPTCGKDGVKTYTCTLCGETKTETIPATGNHSWDEGKVTTEPTCGSTGVKTYTCTVCGETKTETIPAAGEHAWDEGKVTTEPTCGAAGVKTYTCTVCGETVTVTVPATGDHTWDEGKVTTQPTEKEPGTKTYTCTVCGATKTEMIPATGNHVWDEGKITTAPTCGKDGVKTYTCTLCGETTTVTIPATGKHTWDEGKVTTRPTNKTTGVWTYTCTVCGATKTEVIPATVTEGSIISSTYLAMMAQKYNVTAKAGEGGTITPDGVSKVQFNKDITYTITPNEGYEVFDVLVDGKSVGAVTKYTLKNVKADHTISASFGKTAWANPYSDVSSTAWYYPDVKFVTDEGLMNGTGDGMFSPDVIVNRAMLVTVLWRLEGSPVVDSDVEFTDIPANEWYTDAVNWASANGIVNGYGNGIFGAKKDLTHEQIMAILNRYAVYKKLSENVTGDADDSFTNSDWAENNVLWADENGMFEGIGSDISDLTKGADRAELAAYLRRFCEKFMAK